jgi:dTDP-4-dehydrorhamnose reductase
MRVLVFGAAGIVGRATVAEARRRGWPATGFARADADVTDEAAVAAALAAHRPELVVNCAAYTRVDDCERDEAAAARVNDLAVGGLARACDETGARLVHLSTDYVFDGRSPRPYDEAASPAPLSAYGRTKLAGERRALASPRALVVRTSAVFGTGGANFVDTIAGRIRRGEGPLRVVDDQVTAPTYAPFLARALADLGESAATGLVHYRNREPVSWYEFARAVARELASDLEIVPVPTSEFPRPARRPARSVLAVEKFEATCGRRVEPWAEGLERHLAAAAEERR